MRVLKTKWFARFCRKEDIGNEDLCGAVRRAEKGLIDADLGLGVIKQRVPRPGQGRSGGHRVLMGYQASTLAVFLYGFSKNERDNIDGNELATLRDIAAVWHAKDNDQLKKAVEDGLAEEVKYE